MRAGAKWGSVVMAAFLALTVSAAPALAGQQGIARGGSPGHGRPVNGFAPGGLWNTPLPANVPLAANSAAIVANIALDQQTRRSWTRTTCCRPGPGPSS